MERSIKTTTLGLGLVCMAVEQIGPWPLTNPDALFAFGAGLVVCPLALHFRAALGEGGE